MSTPGSEAWAFQHWGQPCQQPIVVMDFCGKPVPVNAKALPHFEALEDIFLAHEYGRSIDDIYDDWGYACRRIGGTSTWSNHAWGIAVDLNATRNPMHSGSRGDIPMSIITRAEAIGFRWGGRYSTPDPMHFETLLTPAQIEQRFTQPKEWDEMATKQEIKQVVRSVVKDELDKARKLMMVGEKRNYSAKNNNVESAVEQLTEAINKRR